MYAVIDENKQLKEASPGITRDLAMVALALAKAGKLPNVSFKKQKNLYFIEASEASWEKANRRLKRFDDLTIYSIKYPAYLLGFALIMQKYVEITANGEIVNGTLKLNEIAAKTLLELIKNEGNSNLHTEYGVFSIFQTAFIRQDILYTENNKICMHDAVLSYFVLANDKTWDNLLATGENI